MPLVTVGRDLIAKQIIGNATTSVDWNNANSFVIVGDSTQTFSSSQLDMGSTGVSRAFKGMTGGFPTYSVTSGGAPLISFAATFTTSEGNFAWNEWGVKNVSSSASGDLLNRKQEALGTKASTQAWAFTGGIIVTT